MNEAAEKRLTDELLTDVRIILESPLKTLLTSQKSNDYFVRLLEINSEKDTVQFDVSEVRLQEALGNLYSLLKDPLKILSKKHIIEDISAFDVNSVRNQVKHLMHEYRDKHLENMTIGFLKRKLIEEQQKNQCHEKCIENLKNDNITLNKQMNASALKFEDYRTINNSLRKEVLSYIEINKKLFEDFQCADFFAVENRAIAIALHEQLMQTHDEHLSVTLECQLLKQANQEQTEKYKKKFDDLNDHLNTKTEEIKRLKIVEQEFEKLEKQLKVKECDAEALHGELVKANESQLRMSLDYQFICETNQDLSAQVCTLQNQKQIVEQKYADISNLHQQSESSHKKIYNEFQQKISEKDETIATFTSRMNEEMYHNQEQTKQYKRKLNELEDHLNIKRDENKKFKIEHHQFKKLKEQQAEMEDELRRVRYEKRILGERLSKKENIITSLVEERNEYEDYCSEMSDAFNDEGVELFNEKKYNEAKFSFSNANLFFRNPEAVYSRGLCHMRMNEYGSALADFQSISEDLADNMRETIEDCIEICHENLRKNQGRDSR